ncbi:MAG: hypothetical protein OEW39_04075 [Deltaproteobacteria bacterium]|nr:hypothetical protein [Deltaproteobacteria bacterium]
MDTYHIWCNLREGVRDLEFCGYVERYLGALREQGLIGGHRLTRRKLGLGPPELGEFHIAIEVKDLAQLDAAFRRVARRDGEVESLHAPVYRSAKDLRFALYRDFPGTERE